MVRRTILGVFGAAVMVAAMSAQAPAQPPKGIAVDRGRPTQHDDPLPVFDFAYFIGTWSFEWDVPEGPMGAAGTITGKTVYRAIGAQTYEAATTATGPKRPPEYSLDSDIATPCIYRVVTNCSGHANPA